MARDNLNKSSFRIRPRSFPQTRPTDEGYPPEKLTHTQIYETHLEENGPHVEFLLHSATTILSYSHIKISIRFLENNLELEFVGLTQVYTHLVVCKRIGLKGRSAKGAKENCTII